MALKKRSELKRDGKIVSGYVAYPARLMVKADSTSGYELVKDFSKEKVEFK